MDEKMTELFQQGKYLKGLKRYIEVAAEETPTAQHFSDSLPPSEGPKPIQHRSQISGRNSQMMQHQSANRGQQQQQQQYQQQQRGGLHQQNPGLMPSRNKITKESIIKFDRNSSAGSVALALLMIIILSIIFFSTL